MLKILVAILTLVALSIADGPVLKTGQIKSYDENGMVVTDGSVKDDGYYQAGASRSYSRSGDIVIDNATGLQWEDNESISKKWITWENYEAGNYNDTSGDTAMTYCEEFTLGGYTDWRLPAIEELNTLSDEGEHNPALSDGIFQNYGLYVTHAYWSSSTSANYSLYACRLGFESGSVWNITLKYWGRHVRCVRGEQLEPANLSRGNNTVSDSTSGLHWQDNEIVKKTTRTWREAIEYCESLIFDSSGDWRLPNKKELLSIVDFSRFYPAMDTSVFQNYSTDYYWSSTTTENNTSNAWYVYFDDGHSYGGYISSKSTNRHYVRCVRDGELNSRPCPNGEKLKQGEGICIPGTTEANPGTYLPNCDSGQLMQGTNTCNDTAEPVDPPGVFLPVCGEGERLVQGTSECYSVNTAPKWTQALYDTGLTIEDSTDDPQIIKDLTAVCSDIEGDLIAYDIINVGTILHWRKETWKNSAYIENGVLKLHNLMSNDPDFDGTITVTIRATATGGSNDTDIRFVFNDVQ